MPYITYSHHPNIIYHELLNKMSKSGGVGELHYYVVEVTPQDAWTGIYYELYSGEPPTDVTHRFVEMVVKPIGMFDRTTTLQGIKAINKIMRRIGDDKVNATERAIRHVRELGRWGTVADCNWSYWQTLEGEISRIVNKEL